MHKSRLKLYFLHLLECQLTQNFMSTTVKMKESPYVKYRVEHKPPKVRTWVLDGYYTIYGTRTEGSRGVRAPICDSSGEGNSYPTSVMRLVAFSLPYGKTLIQYFLTLGTDRSLVTYWEERTNKTTRPGGLSHDSYRRLDLRSSWTSVIGKVSCRCREFNVCRFYR